MGYVRTTLGIGISFPDTDEEENVNEEISWCEIYEKLKQYAISNGFGDIDEDEDDDDIEFDLKQWFETEKKLTWNCGYYHSEVTLAFIMYIEDNDIRSGQDFNFNFEQSDLNVGVIDMEILNFLGIQKEDLIYQILVYNY